MCDNHLGPTQASALQVVKAPRASNPNLHAQSGVFTESSEVESLEQTVGRLGKELTAAGHPFMGRPLVRYDLPCSESPNLLRLLAEDQIDGARMFPGREGVVRAMKERCLWDP